MEVETVYTKDMVFEVRHDGHVATMDAIPKNGGTNSGMTPKELLLGSLGGCTGMDVVAILKKMKVSFKIFKVDVSAEKSKTEPIVFTSIHMKYIFEDVQDKAKAEKAVTLSQEKYCGISAMLKQAAKVTWEIIFK